MTKRQLKQLIKQQIKTILVNQIKSGKDAYNQRTMFSKGGGKQFGKWFMQNKTHRAFFQQHIEDTRQIEDYIQQHRDQLPNVTDATIKYFIARIDRIIDAAQQKKSTCSSSQDYLCKKYQNQKKQNLQKYLYNFWLASTGRGSLDSQ